MSILRHSQFNIPFKVDKVYIVVNTLAGSIVEFTDAEYDCFQNNPSELPKAEIAHLKEEGFFIQNSLDEIALLRNAYVEKKFLKDVANIIIGVTLECNFSCPYCFEMRQKGSMDKNTQKKVLKYLETILDRGIQTLNIDWFGGEPLLYPEVIFSLSKKINDLCIKKHITVNFSITTNGYLLNRSLVIKLINLGLSTIKVTLDGKKRIHDARRKLKSGKGTFDGILNNINDIQDLTVSILIRVNIDKTNTDSYSDVCNTLNDYPNVTVYPALVTFEDEQDLEQKAKCYSHREYDSFYKSVQDKNQFYKMDSELYRGVCSCMAEHKYSFVIDHLGYVYKCVNDIGHKEAAISSVFDFQFYGVTAVAKYLGRDPFTENECKDCKYIPLCYGGCMSEYMDKGSHACPPIRYLLGDLIGQNIREKKGGDEKYEDYKEIPHTT